MSTRLNPIHPYRLSQHSQELLRVCERKFQIERLLQTAEQDVAKQEFGVSLIRGTAFGVAVQEYLISGDWDAASLKLWLAYEPEVYDEKKKIYLWRVWRNFQACREELDKIRSRYEVAMFNGKPAAELGFRLDVDGRWHYAGYIDLVLRDRLTGLYMVLEIKTTAYNLIDLKPLYQNSGQGLGYSIVIDKIVGEEQARYGILYFVCRDKQSDGFLPDVYTFPFNKTLTDRLRWLYTLKLDVSWLNTLHANNLFPMRGESCIKYNRPCPHFGSCSLTGTDRERMVPEGEVVYDFRYNLDEVIADHIKRVGSATAGMEEVKELPDMMVEES